MAENRRPNRILNRQQQVNREPPSFHDKKYIYKDVECGGFGEEWQTRREGGRQTRQVDKVEDLKKILIMINTPTDNW